LSLANDILNLVEAAFRRKETVRELSNLSSQIAVHIFQLVSYPSSRDRKGWIKELKAWASDLRLKNVGRIKNRPNLTKKEILRVLNAHFETEGDIDALTLTVISKGLPEPPDFDPEETDRILGLFVDSIFDPVKTPFQP